MINPINLTLVYLTLAVRLLAQNPNYKIHSQADSMATNGENTLMRWAGVTMRIPNQEIIYSDETSIIIGLNGHPDRLLATYAFNPKILSANLQHELSKLTTIVLSNFGTETNQEVFHSIPEWIASIYQLESLGLSNAELSNFTICGRLPLKYLDLRGVQYIDKTRVLDLICNLKSLEILVHDQALSTEDLSFIKECLPSIKFASKGSANKKP